MKYEYDFMLDPLDMWLNDIDWDIINTIDWYCAVSPTVANKLKFEYISGPDRIYNVFQRTVFPCHMESIESLESIL